MPERISADILAAPLEGLNLNGGTLADELGDRPCVLVFLRHFGCMFCREMVRDVRGAAEQPGYPPVLFFFQGSVDEGRTFFNEYHPDARAVADLPKKFYTALGLRRATLGQMIGIQVWTCGFRALAKGNFVGKVVGDPWIMPGVFLVHGGDILWAHHFEHQADHPDWASIPRQLPVISH
jgi:hypothetical protein